MREEKVVMFMLNGEETRGYLVRELFSSYQVMLGNTSKLILVPKQNVISIQGNGNIYHV